MFFYDVIGIFIFIILHWIPVMPLPHCYSVIGLYFYISNVIVLSSSFLNLKSYLTTISTQRPFSRCSEAFTHITQSSAAHRIAQISIFF